MNSEEKAQAVQRLAKGSFKHISTFISHCNRVCYCKLQMYTDTIESISQHSFPTFNIILTLKAPITTEADDKFCNIFSKFSEKSMIFHENRLPVDDSHELSCLICYF